MSVKGCTICVSVGGNLVVIVHRHTPNKIYRKEKPEGYPDSVHFSSPSYKYFKMNSYNDNENNLSLFKTILCFDFFPLYLFVFSDQNSAQLRDLWVLIKNPNNGIMFQNHRYRLRTYTDCIIGSELVDWLIQKDKAAQRWDRLSCQIQNRVNVVHSFIQGFLIT